MPIDSGAIEIAGKPVAFDSPAKSREAGIAVVYQDLSLVESLSVADNLLLGREPRARFGFVRKRELMAQAGAFLTQLGIPLDIKATVGSLPFAYRQMTEIAKALMGEVRLLILDEPTSSLTSDEVRILFDAIGKVTRRGVRRDLCDAPAQRSLRDLATCHGAPRRGQCRYVRHCRHGHESAW